jgi:hypothetical protein
VDEVTKNMQKRSFWWKRKDNNEKVRLSIRRNSHKKQQTKKNTASQLQNYKRMPEKPVQSQFPELEYKWPQLVAFLKHDCVNAIELLPTFIKGNVCHPQDLLHLSTNKIIRKLSLHNNATVSLELIIDRIRDFLPHWLGPYGKVDGLGNGNSHGKKSYDNRDATNRKLHANDSRSK